MEIEGVRFEERPDDPGPLRRLFMTYDNRGRVLSKVSWGFGICIALGIGLDFFGTMLVASGNANVMTVMQWNFVGILIMVFGWFVQRWANG